jgi:hemoglobin
MTSSLYEEIGGAPAVDVAVGAFYRKVLTDPAINHFFDGIDRKMLQAKQKAFLTMVMGGPSAYEGKDMRAAHAHLVKRGLNDTHFDAVVRHLKDTLEELRVPVGAATQILAAAGSLRNDVLGR